MSDASHPLLVPQTLGPLVLELKSRAGAQVGFILFNTGEEPVVGVKLEWEYEAAGSSHPRSAPLKDRLSVDLGPGESISRWFDYTSDDGSIYVLAAIGSDFVTFNVVPAMEDLPQLED